MYRPEVDRQAGLMQIAATRSASGILGVTRSQYSATT
jgi:hypothetical protein